MAHRCQARHVADGGGRALASAEGTVQQARLNCPTRRLISFVRRPSARTLTIHAVEGEQVALDSGTWQIGKLIDEGGAGQVYEATGPDGVPAAVKFVIGGVTSKREFEFDNLADATQVMPIPTPDPTKGTS
jgi:hypothetical protein